MKRKACLILLFILIIFSMSFNKNFNSVEGMENVSNLIIDNNEDNINDSLNQLLGKYTHNGFYIKKSNIYLKKESLNEVSTIFHAQSTLLERTTYYKDNALWMTNECGKFSYYGTDKNGNLTNGNVSNVGDVVSTIALKMFLWKNTI